MAGEGAAAVAGGGEGRGRPTSIQLGGGRTLLVQVGRAPPVGEGGARPCRRCAGRLTNVLQVHKGFRNGVDVLGMVVKVAVIVSKVAVWVGADFVVTDALAASGSSDSQDPVA